MNNVIKTSVQMFDSCLAHKLQDTHFVPIGAIFWFVLKKAHLKLKN